MTTIEYYNKLKKLLEDCPECANMPVIYSHDDEGNTYQKVINEPGLFQAEDTNAFYLEPALDDSGNERVDDLNCVIIN